MSTNTPSRNELSPEILESAAAWLENVTRDPKRLRSESIEALWRFARLGNLSGDPDQWVEIRALECRGPDYLWPKDDPDPMPGTAVAYLRTAQDVLSAVIVGDDGHPDSPVRIDTLGATAANLRPVGYYLIPGRFPREAIAEEREIKKEVEIGGVKREVTRTDPLYGQGLQSGNFGWHKVFGHLIDDEKIQSLTMVSVDIDPKRMPANSSHDELVMSLAVARQIHRQLVALGIRTEAIGLGCSGNGARCDVAVDLPVSPENRRWVGRYLAALARRFDVYDGPKQLIDIDQSCANPSRLIPLYGTAKCKGEHTENRPQRRSWFKCTREVLPLSEAEFRDLVVALEEIAAPYEDRSQAKIIGETRLPPKNLGKISMDRRMERARLWLARVAPAVQGGRHNSCRSVALALARGFALGEDALDMVQEWAAECDPPLEEREVESLVSWAVEKGTIPMGSKLGARAERALTDEQLTDMAVMSEPLQVEEPSPISEDVSEEAAEPVEPEPEVPADRKYNLTDAGNAERLWERHRARIRYVEEWKSWLVWDGTRWVQDKALVSLRRLALETVRAMYGEAQAEEDTTRRAAVAKHALESERKSAINAMISMAEPLAAITANVLDRDHWLLNCPNGTVNLRTGKLRPHNPRDYITRICRVAYDPQADRRLVDSTLATCVPDADMRAYLWRLWGYSATGDVGEHVLPIHYGKGRNGKGTFLNSIQAVLGDYATQVPTELLMETRGDSHPTDRATLFGIRLAVAVETEEGKQLKVGLVKQLTGGDPISTRRMREDFWTFLPTHTLQLATNHKPAIRDTTDSIWERVHLIPWTVQIPKEQRDTQLLAKLSASPGLLRAVVEGCVDYCRLKGLGVPEAIQAASATYREESDTLGEFVQDYITIREDGFVSNMDLYRSYKTWAEMYGHGVLSNKRFTQRMNEAGIGTPGHSSDGKARGRRGIVLTHSYTGEDAIPDEAPGDVGVEDHDPDYPTFDLLN